MGVEGVCRRGGSAGGVGEGGMGVFDVTGAGPGDLRRDCGGASSRLTISRCRARLLKGAFPFGDTFKACLTTTGALGKGATSTGHAGPDLNAFCGRVGDSDLACPPPSVTETEAIRIVID